MEYLPNIVAIVLVLVFVALMMSFVLRMLREFFRALRGFRLRDVKYEPVEDPCPASPVEDTAGIKWVALLVLLWAAAHVAVAVGWALTGALVPRRPTWYVAAVYAVVASLTAGVGAVMLLCRRRGGRKGVTWGLFLLCIMAFLMLAVCLMAPSDPHAPEALRRIGYWLAGLFGMHLVIDTTLGTLAQRLARPAGWSDAEGRVVEGTASEKDAKRQA